MVNKLEAIKVKYFVYYYDDLSAGNDLDFRIILVSKIC